MLYRFKIFKKFNQLIQRQDGFTGAFKSCICIAAVICAVIVFMENNTMDRHSTLSAVCNDCYENRVAITFDDGPRSDTTGKLLDGLKERNVKATFFMIGENIEKNQELVRRINDEGHLIGNHTYTHVQLSAISADKACNEIIKTNEEIEKVTGICPKYIRPPYGSYSNKLLMKINMIPVLWTVDPKDWDTTDVSGVVRKVVDNTKCGDIILLHDIYPSSVAAALEIVDELKAKGFVFVTVDQIILD